MESSKSIPPSSPKSPPSDKKPYFSWMDRMTKASFSTLHSLGSWFYKNTTPLAIGGIGITLISRSVRTLSFKDLSPSLQTMYKLALLSIGIKSIEWASHSLRDSTEEDLTPSQKPQKNVTFCRKVSETPPPLSLKQPKVSVCPLTEKQEALEVDPRVPFEKIIYRRAEAKFSPKPSEEALEIPLTKEEVLFNLRENPKSLAYADLQFLDDPEIMLTAIELDIKTFGLCGDRLKSDQDFLVQAGCIDPNIVRFLDPDKKMNAKKQKMLLAYIEKKRLQGLEVDTLKNTLQNALVVVPNSEGLRISPRKKSSS